MTEETKLRPWQRLPMPKPADFADNRKYNE
jgi:hypothetical protein